ncbi:hypothetical protein CEB3_c18710 [Peptococcaceae bacterium CEB3]|nr:hypothetical protein CEB3_c18710 [Peptococcaceae bacterium CEB3]
MSIRQKQWGKLILFGAGLVIAWGFAGIGGWAYDPGWHVHNGLWMLRHHAILHRDGFTWKAPDTPWANAEWGFDLLAGWIYSLFGWAGDRWLVVVVYGCLFGLILWHSRLKIPEFGWLWLCFFFAAGSAAVVRPQIFSYLFFAIALVGILRGRNLSLLSLLVIPWNNTHASAILWLGLLGIETLIQRDWRTLWKPWFISLGGFFVSPTSLGSLVAFTKMQGNRLSLLIPEYRSPNFHGALPWIVIGFALIAGYQVIKRGDLRSKLWVFFGTAAFLFSRRLGIYSAIIDMLVIECPPLTPALKKVMALVTVGVFSVFLMTTPIWITQPFARPVEYQAVQYLKSVHAVRVLNQYEYGSTMEMAGLKPICDGRDIWLGQSWYDHYFETLVGQYPLRRLLRVDIPNAKYMVFPNHSIVADQIWLLPGWHQVYDDGKVSCWTKTTN